jgi:hypothetical protein
MSSTVLFVLAFILIIASRVLLERHLRNLTAEQKGVLIDEFAAQRMYSYVPMVVIFLASVGAMYAFPLSSQPILWATWAALGIYIVILSVASGRKLRSLKMPLPYIRAYVISRMIQVVALILIFVSFSVSRAVG